MIDSLDIGYAIKDRRAQLGLTQAQVAEAAGVSKRCLWSMELGRNPGVQLDKLTAVLGVLGLDLAILPTEPPCGAAEMHKGSAPAKSQPRKASEASPGDAGIDALAILTGGAGWR